MAYLIENRLNGSDFVSELMKTTNEIFTPYFGENLNFRGDTSFQESKDTFFIELSMPGFSKKEVDLQVKDDILSLKAERKDRAGESIKVSKRYRLPRESEKSELNASLDKGILFIEIPKTKKASSISIEID